MSNNKNRKQYNERKMQQTSRFTPKIREYLAELPNERELELERFMALSSSSPASSSVSVGAHSIDAMRSGSRSRSRCGSEMVVATATTAAVAETTTTKTTAGCTAAMECMRIKNKAPQIINIPIVMETIASSSSSSKPTASVSAEDLCTPTKGTHTTTPQMQTRKTQTPESALKSHKRLEWDPAADVGYRCERAASVSNISTLERSVLEAAIQPNRSESDLNRLQQQQQKQHGAMAPPRSSAQPPLASSTFVNSQTMTTPVPSQSSRRESGVTSAASSFDYHHHHHHNSQPSSNAATSCSSNSSRHTLSAEELLRHVEQQRQEREYTAQLQQVLCNNRRQQNKENLQAQPPPPSSRAKSSASSSAASSASCPSGRGDLDLGIDLLCSLVNKRSLSYGQKKQLIRDIAKRLACLDLVSSSNSNSRAESTRSSRRSKSVSQHKEHDQLQLQQQPREQTSNNDSHSKDTLSQWRTDRATNTSNRSTLDKSVAKQVTPPVVSAPVAAAVPASAAAAAAPAPVPAPRTRVATPAQSPLQSCSYVSTSSGASNELVTQKTNLRSKSRSSADAAELFAMREWLHPMTQSEIDYEAKRLQLRLTLDEERRSQLDWIDMEIRRLRMLQNLLNDVKREVNLTPQPPKSTNIPIQRANVPATDEPNQRQAKRPAPPAPPVTPVSTPLPAAVTVPVEVAQVAASAPKTISAIPPTPPPPPPPPPVSRPLPIHQPAAVHQQMQRSKMATPNTLSHSGSSESVCSFIQQRQRQFMAHYQNQQQQRLEQQQQLFMLQRHQQQQQQQLIHRQQQHLHPTCQMHQHVHQCHQQEQQQQRQPQQQQHYIQMQYAHGMGNDYSCLDEGAVYYQVVNSQSAPCYVHATEVAPASAVAPAAAPAATAASAAAAPAAAVATVTATAVAKKAALAAASSNSCTSTSSTSSMLCISSEMSIPMGMVNACEATTTTTTTTHQYDDVACHQQLQLRRRLRHHHHHAHREHNVHQVQHEQRQQMLQVRPRGIAYVIEFTASGDASEMLSNALSLQEHLQLARPMFCAQSKQRKAILNEMQLLRNQRRRELDQIIENSSLETLDRRLHQLPPPVTSRVRIFSTKEMKALTNKRCESLPEVLAAQNRELEARRRRSNRIMRDVFNRRLQRRVRRGKLSLNHSRTVI